MLLFTILVTCGEEPVVVQEKQQEKFFLSEDTVTVEVEK